MRSETAISSVARHVVAWAAAAAVVATLPGIAAGLSSRLDHLLGLSGGVSFYVAGWRASGATTVTGIGDVVNPFSPGPLTILLVLLGCSLVGERVVAKHRWVRWGYPAVPAVAIGAVLAMVVTVMLAADLPRSLPLVVGLAACAFVGVVAGVHWGVLRMLG